jgi:hypothetical protein
MQAHGIIMGRNGITFSVTGAMMIRDFLLGVQNGDAELFRFGRK